MMNGPRIFSLLISIIILFIDVFIFRNTQEIQKPGYTCQCANTYQIKRISQTILTIISLNLLLLVGMLMINILTKNNVSFTASIKMFSVIIMIISLCNIFLQAYYLYLMITYVNDLDNNKCSCVDQTFVSTVKYYSWTRLSVAVLSILMVVMILAFMPKNTLKPKKL